ncbi:MAG: hypothetical protein ACTSQT_06380 [Promethearchaeota archaeon]
MTEYNKIEPFKDHFLYSLLNPRSIAIFGANNNLLTTMGSMQLHYDGFDAASKYHCWRGS